MTSVRRTSALGCGAAARRRAGDDRRGRPRQRRPQAGGTFVDASGASVGWLRLTEDRRGDVHVNVHVEGPDGGPPRHPYPRGRIVLADVRGGRRPLQPAGSPARAGEPERAARGRPAEPDRQRPGRRPSRRQHRPGDPVRGRRRPCSMPTAARSSSTPTRTTRSPTRATAEAAPGSRARSSSPTDRRRIVSAMEVPAA